MYVSCTPIFIGYMSYNISVPCEKARFQQSICIEFGQKWAR